MEYCSNGLLLRIAEVPIVIRRNVACITVFVWLFRRSPF